MAEAPAPVKPRPKAEKTPRPKEAKKKPELKHATDISDRIDDIETVFEPFKSTEIAETAIKTAELKSHPEAPRIALEVLASRGDVSVALERRADELLKKPEPVDQAFGMDLKKEALLFRSQGLIERINILRSKRKPSEHLEKQLDETKKQIEQAKKERTEFSNTHGGLKNNQLNEFAKLFGVEDEFLQKAPLVGVADVLRKATQNKEARAKLDDSLTTNNAPESIKNTIDEMLKAQSRREKMQKVRKGSLVVAGGAGLLMMLSAWMAMKSESRQQGA